MEGRGKETGWFRREYAFLKEVLNYAHRAAVVHHTVKDPQLLAGDTQGLHQAPGCVLPIMDLKPPATQGLNELGFAFFPAVQSNLTKDPKMWICLFGFFLNSLKLG